MIGAIRGKHLQMAADAAALVTLIPAALLWGGGADPARALLRGLFVAVVTLLSLILGGAYSRTSWRRTTFPLMPTVEALTRAAVITVVSALIVDGVVLRTPLTWTVVGMTGALILTRGARWAIVSSLQHRGRLRERVLLVGGEGARHDVVDWLVRRPSAFSVIGVLSEFRARGTSVHGVPVLGDPAAMDEVVDAYGVTRIVVFPGAISWETEQAAIDLAVRRSEVAVLFTAGYTDLLAADPTSPGPGMPTLVQMRPAGMGRMDAIAKRTMDLVVAGALLPALAVELAILRLARLRDAQPPLLRTETVLGRGAHPFGMYLLARTPHSRWRAALARGRAGKLPLILNVLRGEMSIVGPRPIPVASANLAQARFLRIHTARPGLTGPWKFSAQRSGATEHLLDDLYYVRTRTLWLDGWLVMRSAFRFVTRRTPVPMHYGQVAAGRAAAPATPALSHETR